MRSLSLALTLIIFSFSAATADVATASRDKAASNRSDTKPPQIEVCFVLDTTGSMGGLIQGAKDKIWSIATEMIQADPKPQIRFGLIGYRDRGDDYVTKRFDLTEDIDSIYGKLTAFKAAGGGDGPESVNQALSESVRTMDWTENSDVLKIIFLVGDAPPHMDYDEVKYPKTCRKAKKKQLIINTIQCGQMAGTAEVWQSIAQSAGGEYAAILQSGGTVALHTPHDRRIADLNMQLNATICVYGSAKEQRAADVKIQAQAVANDEAVADRAAYFSKSRASAGMGGGGYTVMSGTRDLVAMLLSDEIKMDAIEKDQLPKELQSSSKEALKQELERRVAKRKEVQAAMAKAVDQRSKFLAEAKKNQPADAFDNQVKSIVRDQAAAKGIHLSD